MSQSFKLYLSVSAGALLALTEPSFAQQSQQPIVLPGIVVQGATLEKAPVAPKRQPQSQADADDDAPSAAPQQAPKKAPPKPTPQGQAKQAAAAVPAAPVASAASANAVAADAGLRAGIPASEVGTAVTVVTSREIGQSQARTSADVLRALPGVNVGVTGSSGGLTQVRIRGAEGKHTRVLIDGIEANTTKDAEYDFSSLSPDDIERIEVIRGPMSALYGSGALGGVINIETKGARGPLALQVRAEGGSFGTKDVSGRLAGGSDAGFVSLSAQSRDVRGFVVAPGGAVRQGTNLQSYGLHAGATLAPTAKLDMTLRYTEKRADITGFGDTDLSPTKPYFTADDSASKLLQRTLLGGVRLSWDALDGALSQQLKANYNNDVAANDYLPLYGFSAGIKNRARDESGRMNWGYQATYRLPESAAFGRHAFTGLVEKQVETFKPFSDYDTSFGDYNGDNKERMRSTLSTAGEWRGTFADRLALTAGIRRDNNDSFQDFTTWRSSVSYNLKETGTRPHASLGTGVKLPGMYDQFGANGTNYQSNPNLKPETSRGYDVGIEQTLLGGRLLADITYFNQDLRDKIGLNGFDLTTFRLFPTNAVGISTRRGWETSLQYQVTPALFLGAAYTYTDAKQPDGTAEFRRTPHGGRVEARYQFDEGKGSLGAIAIYNSRTPDAAFSFDTFGNFARSTVFLDSYWKLQLAASYKVQPNVELYGRLENALNAKYQDVYGYNTAGFGAYAGVKIAFDNLLGTGKK